jgi:hypothetical protein
VTRRGAAFAAIAVLWGSAFVMHAAADGCPAGYKQVGTKTEETADAIIVHPVCDPIETPPALPGLTPEAKAYCRDRQAVTAQIAPALRDLRKISPNTRKWQRDMDAWVHQGEEARTEARIKAASAAYDVVSTLAHQNLESKAALDENAIHTIDSLYASGYHNVPAPFRAELQHEVTTLHTKHDLLILVDHLKLTADRVYGTAKPMSEGGTLEGFGQFGAGVLQESLELMKNADPAAAMTVTAFDMSTTAAYGWWARLAAEHRVNELIGLNEQQLAVAQSLSKVYIDGVDKKIALEKAWHAKHVGPLPACHD